MAPEQPKHVHGTHHSCNRMEEPDTQKNVAAGREVLHQRVSQGVGRKDCVPRLASEPVVPMTIMDTRPNPMAIPSYRFARTAKCRPGLESHFAVSASAARSKR